MPRGQRGRGQFHEGQALQDVVSGTVANPGMLPILHSILTALLVALSKDRSCQGPVILCTKSHVGQRKRPRVREELWTQSSRVYETTTEAGHTLEQGSTEDRATVDNRKAWLGLSAQGVQLWTRDLTSLSFGFLTGRMRIKPSSQGCW